MVHMYTSKGCFCVSTTNRVKDNSVFAIELSITKCLDEFIIVVASPICPIHPEIVTAPTIVYTCVYWN